MGWCGEATGRGSSPGTSGLDTCCSVRPALHSMRYRSPNQPIRVVCVLCSRTRRSKRPSALVGGEHHYCRETSCAKSERSYFTLGEPPSSVDHSAKAPPFKLVLGARRVHCPQR